MIMYLVMRDGFLYLGYSWGGEGCALSLWPPIKGLCKDMAKLSLLWGCNVFLRLLQSRRLISAARHCISSNTPYQWKVQEQTHILIWGVGGDRTTSCGDQAS